ncbi:hypothetical protein J577_2254 [Acinetobacter sp. 263903-1]|nr:hypothetical protein J546_0807 [Acinetobacter sp. 1461402]EXB73201.1 hypothetical protein J550_1129 [Acinetobacter sp. 230853]EXC33556.1 hypothetical protein J520_0881 [Acinetobacter sp. 869535]KCX36613.1 hypothetical protein J577_2254 [Acinetobacter sp. 263903-1]
MPENKVGKWRDECLKVFHSLSEMPFNVAIENYKKYITRKLKERTEKK